MQKNLSLKKFTLIFTIVPFLIFAQGDIDSQIENFKEIEDMGYICEGKFAVGKFGCGDTLFWNVVQMKEQAIEPLIERLADTTKSKAFVPNFGGHWTIGDISYATLQEIIHGIPTFDLLPVEFDASGCCYCSYWQYLRQGRENRLKFQKAVQDWLRRYRENLIWVSDYNFSSCDCRGQHPNGGHFEVKK